MRHNTGNAPGCGREATPFRLARHCLSIDGWIPSSAAIRICGRPLLSSSATASRLNSGVNSRLAFAIQHHPRPHRAYQRCPRYRGRISLARSTYHDAPTAPAPDDAVVSRIRAIGEEFEAYGYRRICAELRHQGLVVNSKKVRRLMREHDLQPRRRRRYVATTDSDHEQPIYPNLAPELVPSGPDQLWVADITYVPIIGSFVYVAVILDAWSRRVVGYAISRSIDARLAIAALNAAIQARRPSAGCVHHSDQESQDGFSRSEQHPPWTSTTSAQSPPD